MLELGREEFIRIYLDAGGKKKWYGYPRGYEWKKEIYINKDAFYLNKRDYRLLIDHEQGHVDGKKHTIFGLMSQYAVIRYLTTW